MISQANKSLAALAVLKYMFRRDSQSAFRNKRAKGKTYVVPKLNVLRLAPLIGLLVNLCFRVMLFIISNEIVVD